MDSDLLKIGKDLRKEHKELARDLSSEYIGAQIESPSHYAVRSLLPSD
jgi:hypothetical protein